MQGTRERRHTLSPAKRIRREVDPFFGHKVLDSASEELGTVSATYVDDVTQQEYVTVAMGPRVGPPGQGTRPIPVEISKVDNARRRIEVSRRRSRVVNAPPIGDAVESLTDDFLARLRSHYGL